jgi:hypothetical protein
MVSTRVAGVASHDMQCRAMVVLPPLMLLWVMVSTVRCADVCDTQCLACYGAATNVAIGCG